MWPPNESSEQTYIFLFSCAAATIAAIVFSKGAPYRKPLITNGNFAISSVFCILDELFKLIDVKKSIIKKIIKYFIKNKVFILLYSYVRTVQICGRPVVEGQV